MTRYLGHLTLLVALTASLATAQATPAGVPAGFREFDSRRDTIGALHTPISLDQRLVPRRLIIQEIVRQASLSFVLDPDLPGLDDRVSLAMTAVPAGVALARVLEGSRLRLLISDRGHIVIRPAPPSPPAERATAPWRVSGRVRDARTLEPIGDAQVTVNGGAPYLANGSGLFTVPVAGGTVALRVMALGFAPRDTSLSVVGHVVLDLQLTPRRVELAAVAVEASSEGQSDLDPRSTTLGVARIRPQDRRLAPPLLGEPDPIRDLTTLPGVGTATDASVALTVRGGRTDGNLFLLDGAPVYNPSHAFGVLSSVHAEAIDAVTLHKGSAPARFGGRLSSVIDLRQREGNAREVAGSAAVGLLSSRFLVEGPVGERATFMVGGRRSYADVLFRAVADDEGSDGVAYFYDLNGKLTVRTSTTSSLSASGFVGRDRFGLDEREGAEWGNYAGSLRWNQVLARRLLSTVTLSRGSYDFAFNSPDQLGNDLPWKATIGSTDLRIEQRLPLANRGSIEFGSELSFIGVRPARLSQLLSGEQPGPAERRNARSVALYAGHELEVGRLALQYGLRWVRFERRGPGTIHQYDGGAPLRFDRQLQRYEPGRVTDSTLVPAGRSFAPVDGIEPRVSLRWSLDPASSLKAGFARQRQYVHMVSGSAVPLPTDAWEPVGPWLQPMASDQFSLGYARVMGGLEWSLEGWLRRAQHVIGYVDGVDVTAARQLESIIEQGDGRARGLELFVRKAGARHAWWVSYTLSRSEERFRATRTTSDGPDGGINDGAWFPATLDRTHMISATGSWATRGRWSFGSTLSAASGLPSTLPLSAYTVGGLVLSEFGARNSTRLPWYHRLDLSATARLRQRGELQFGVLNVLNRFNPQFRAVRQTFAQSVFELVEYSVFRALPTVSYTWRF